MIIGRDIDSRHRRSQSIPLLPDRLARKLPPLFDGDLPGHEAIARVRWFLGDCDWQCFGLEYDGRETLYVLVIDEAGPQFGYIRIKDLSALRGPETLSVDRDYHFQPIPVRDLISIYED